MACRAAAERAVHRAAGVVVVAEQERQVGDAQLGHAVGEIARRLIAEREQTALDQPPDFVGLVAEIHDVPAILDVDAVAELLFQAVADVLERLAEAGGRRSVAAHADGMDWPSSRSLRASRHPAFQLTRWMPGTRLA